MQSALPALQLSTTLDIPSGDEPTESGIPTGILRTTKPVGDTKVKGAMLGQRLLRARQMGKERQGKEER
jgi:hypothetical protein